MSDLPKIGETISLETQVALDAFDARQRQSVCLCADTITTLRARIAELEADKAKLREALEPFASYAEIAEAYNPALRDGNAYYEIDVPLHRLRAARRIYEETA